jgi:hypothetical protein
MIYLYGDSFVENEPAENLGQRDHERWYQMLSKNLGEEHENYGKCGEGPASSLAKFHRHLEEGHFKPNPKFVFFLSSPYRIPWTWLKPQEDPKYSPSGKEPRRNGVGISSAYQDWDVEYEKMNHPHPREVPLNAEYYYTPEEYFTQTSVYESLQDELDHQNLKNVAYLHTLSKLNNWPMMVFRVFGMNPNPFRKKYDVSHFDFEKLNDDTFHFYSTPMNDHSSKEWVDEWIAEAGTMNHFTHRNHIILSNIMTNHFLQTYGTASFLTEQWHEHFIRSVENQQHRRDHDPNTFVDFIYE